MHVLLPFCVATGLPTGYMSFLDGLFLCWHCCACSVAAISGCSASMVGRPAASRDCGAGAVLHGCVLAGSTAQACSVGKSEHPLRTLKAGRRAGRGRTERAGISGLFRSDAQTLVIPGRAGSVPVCVRRSVALSMRAATVTTTTLLPFVSPFPTVPRGHIRTARGETLLIERFAGV
jgi:hypothetical protein